MEKLIGQYVEMLNDRHPQQNGANAGPHNGCPAFAQIKPAKINLSLFGRLSLPKVEDERRAVLLFGFDQDVVDVGLDGAHGKE